jgi:hypothetical protein
VLTEVHADLLLEVVEMALLPLALLLEVTPAVASSLLFQLRSCANASSLSLERAVRIK